MRGIAPIFIVLAIGVSGAMLTGSGFADAWGAPAPQTSAAQEELDNAGNSSDVERDESGDGPISGPVNSQDSSTIGLLASAISTFTEILGAVVLLPVTLTSLGFPAWFAFPAGLLGQIVAVISLAEAATRTEWT